MATLSIASAGSAAASPIASRDTTAGVTADALPTAQINGVAWTQIVVGDTVYVGGAFTAARPAGAAAGTSLSTRNNLMSYTLSTGVMTSWNPNANGTVLAMALSPNKQRLYVAGTFTTIGGVNAQRVAAFDTSTGNLITSFAARTDSQVKAITATDTAVYVGGSFSTANGVARSRLAAFSASNGALLPWNPGANVTVFSMTMNPSLSLVIVGGAFDQIASTPAKGIAALDPSGAGSRIYWAATDTVSDYGQAPGTGAAIYSLSKDGTNVYGTGYNYYGSGNLEGTFSADGNSGAINWVEDCHGDTYGAFATAAAVYTVSHAHYCGNIGGYPQSDPWSINMRHALAFTPQATGTIGHDPLGYFDWYGTKNPSLINWFPEFDTGTYTGQGQAAWSITGNSQYVVAGGEFPKVNGAAQQGLVRFAVPSIAPDKQGPRLNSTNWNPTVRALSSTVARVAISANWDRDDQTLTYQLIRAGKAVATLTASSQYWNLPTLALMDKTASPGTTNSYYVKVTDPNGNAQYSSTVSITMPTSGSLSPYALDVYNDGASNYWRLGESSGTTAVDSAGVDNMTLNGGVTEGAQGAIGGDSDTADTFNGSDGFGATQTAKPGPNLFSEEMWFKTTSTSGGKIVSFGDKNTGTSGNYDRHTYMNPDGTLTFGVYNNASYTITTTKRYNDGQWHQAVGTLSSDGMAFYVDGKRVGTNTGTTIGQNYAGYWRIGGDSPWSGNPYFNGSIDEVAIYPTALTLAQVQQHYVDSGRTMGTGPADKYGKAVYGDSPDTYFRMDDSTGTSAVDASGNGNTGLYSGGETLGVVSPVAGSGHTAVTFNGADGTLASGTAVNNPTVYSEELWFKTTTDQGGKLIGFGSRQTGNSDHYDRHVYMLNSGQLVFGTYTGQLNTLQSANSYNDGTWHYLVATQGPDGMKLYVDNQLVGNNSVTGQENYSGYWRIGGDSSWAASNYFAGTIDEAAVYYSVLTPAQIAAHYAAASAVNRPPVAAFTASASKLKLTADASTSSDPDGTITSYSWDFGDGTTGTGVTPTHVYSAAGTYTVTLTVIDDGGGTNTTTKSVGVTANQAPTAGFTATVSNLSVAFDSHTSSDADGTIAGYSWDFGDGGTSTSANPTHTYASAGNYTVSLTVTDNDGATDVATKQVTTVAANQAPTAAFSASVSGMVATFNSAGSSDPDGTIAGYSWDFGDGGTSASANPTHTYSAGGNFIVKLTVTDNSGATDTVNHSLTIVAPNQAPTAAFTATVSGLAVAFNSADSSDPDGTITGYSWDFGDGGTSTSANPSHTFASANTYTVTLTVTDNSGATGSVSKSVTTTANAPVAVDTFERTVASGWGSATTGGAWTRTTAATSAYAVNGHAATANITAVGGTVSEYLNSVSAQDENGSVDVSFTTAPTGGGVYSWIAVRHTSAGEYRIGFRLQPTSTTVRITKVVSGTETTVASATVAGLVYNAGDVLRIKFDVSGNSTTALKAKVWKVAVTEPASWQINTTDATAALQAAGTLGLTGYLSGAAGTTAPIGVAFDNLNVVQD